MANFTFCHHAEPEVVSLQRWQDSAAPGELRPRRELEDNYLGITVFNPWQAGDASPEIARIDPQWSEMTVGSPNNYVRLMRAQGFVVYYIMLTIMRDHRKFKANPNYVRLHALLPHRAILMLEPYSFWNYGADRRAHRLNPEPPHFETIFDWITKEVACQWSFDVQVTGDWTNFAFEFTFEDRAAAERFVFDWK